MTHRIRLLPIGMAAIGLLAATKLHGLVVALPDAAPQLDLIAAAQAETAAVASPAAVAAAPQAAVIAAAAPQAAVVADQPSPEQRAERAVLEGLRARRTELDAREQAMAARDVVLAAAERRLAQRIEELSALQQRLEAADRLRGEREDAGWRQLVKLYEGMRPRDAATIFDELDLPVLVQVVDRMREARAAPVLAAMRPDRARLLTAELVRHRARPTE